MSKTSSQLKRARAELAHFEKQLARLEARTAVKRSEVERRREEVQRFAAMLTAESLPPQEARSPARDADVPAPTRPPVEPAPVRRTEAILQLLREHSEPMTPSAIAKELRDSGRDDELRSVTATLAHLRSSGAVTRVGRGLYIAT